MYLIVLSSSNRVARLLPIVWGLVMKHQYKLYVSLYSHAFAIWPDCAVGHSCPGIFCLESNPLSRTCSMQGVVWADFGFCRCYFSSRWILGKLVVYILSRVCLICSYFSQLPSSFCSIYLYVLNWPI